MKNLAQFAPFKCEEFLEKKLLAVTNCTVNIDFDSKKPIGSKIEVVITKDDTEYDANSKGEISTNLFEKLVIKVPKMNLVIPNMTYVKLLNPKATIYGEFRNQLSITADDVVVLKNNNKTEA